MSSSSVVDNLVNLLVKVIERIKKDTRFLRIIMACFIIAGSAIFIILYLTYRSSLGAGLSNTLVGLGSSMFSTSVISYIFQIRKNNNRVATLTNMNEQIINVDKANDAASLSTVNDIYKTVFGKLIIDNLN